MKVSNDAAQVIDVLKGILTHDEVKLFAHAEDVFTAKLNASREFWEVGGEVSVRKIDAVIIEIDTDNLRHRARQN